MGNYARRIASGEQMKPRFDRVLHEHRKLLMELVRERLLSRKPMRPVPELTPAQIALHGGLTANREHFTLAAIMDASAVTDASIDGL